MSDLLKKIYAPQDLSLSGSFKASKRFSIRSYLPFWHFSKKAIAWINIVYDMGSIQLFWERLSKNVHVTILKGNMGYDQYTVPDTIDVEPTFVAFLSHSQTLCPWPVVPFFQISLNNSELKTTHNTFQGLLNALVLTNFLKIAVYFFCLPDDDGKRLAKLSIRDEPAWG